MRTIRAAWAQITSRPSRIVATIITILIGIGFACAALVFTSGFRADLGARLSADYAGADLVVTPHTDRPATDIAAQIAGDAGVADAEPLYGPNLEFTSANSHNYLHLFAVPRDPALQWARLTDGAWPTGPGEVVLSQQTSTAANLPVGATLTLTGAAAPGDETAGGPDATSAPERRVTVVGIADTSAVELLGSRFTGFLTPDAFAPLGITFAPQIAVIAANGVDGATLATRLRESLGTDATVRTTAAQADQDVAAFTGQTTALTTVLLAFAAIALIVAGIVIVNTFAILLAGRRRQIALLRCVGATGAQVRRQALAEAGIIGVLGSMLGAAAGIGVGAAAGHVSGLDSGGVVVPWVGIAITTAIGVLLTVGAAVIPASRAMRVPPLAALRPVSGAESERRIGRVRLVVGLALALLGGALLAGGVLLGSLLVALPGGALSAIGVLLLTRSYLPPLLRLVGGIGRGAGVPGRLAAANAVRNPGRAAATSAALVVGVGLIVMLQVAAASVGASVDKAAVDRYPVDVSVVGDGTTIPDDVVSGVRAVPELAHVLPIPGTSAVVTRADGSPVIDTGTPAVDDDAVPSDAASGTPVTVMGVPEDAAGIVRGGLGALTDRDRGMATALVPSWWIGEGAVAIGDTIVVTVDGRSQRFVAAVGHLTDSGVLGMPVLVPRPALEALAGHAGTVAVWGALDHPDGASQAMSAINALVASDPDLWVSGAAADRASLQSVLSAVTTVATGLLAVAVVIAVVGIGNTIGLSVLERTRESALLRALGLRRGQLRLTLALEAMLLALIGGAVGVALGLVYGWAGAAATFGEIGQELVLSVPWGMVVLLLVAAVAAGALSSVLPARRAVRTQPVEALAEE